MNESKDNGSIKEFEKALKPFIQSRDEAIRKLQSLRDGLKSYEGQKDDLQKKLNELVRASLESGKIELNENIPKAKSELDSVSLIITDIEGNAIPRATEAVKQSNEALASNLKTLLEPLRSEFQGKIDVNLSEVEALADEWMMYLDRLLPRVGITFDYWVKEGLYRLKPPSDKDMKVYNRLLSL